MIDKISLPMTEQDLFRAKHSYTFLVDFLDIVPWEKMKVICAVFGGMRIRFPTIDELTRLKDDYAMAKEIENSPMDPDSVSEIAKKHKRPPRTAEQIYREMTQLQDHRLSGEYDIYGDQHSHFE